MSDHEIRTLLKDMAEDVQHVRPLAHKALRRTRARRWSIAATVVASVVTIAAGGAGLALEAGPFRDSGAIRPAGSPEGTPPPPKPMPGTIVGYGTSPDGHEWWLSAYESESGQLCVGLQLDTGDIREDCSDYDPEGVGLARDPHEGTAPRAVFGWVPTDTDGAWVTWAAEIVEDGGPEDETSEEEEETPGSESEEAPPAEEEDEPRQGPNMDLEIRGDEKVDLFDAPEGFPFPVKFYALVPPPEDARAIRVMLADGDATVIIFSGRPQDYDGRGELVAHGQHEGYPWELYARTSGDERCLDLVWADEQFGSGGSCSTAVPRAESFQYSLMRFDGEHSSTVAFYAAVSKEVASLELRLDDGIAIGLEIIEGPAGSEVDYALAWPPAGDDGVVRGSVIARDDAGDVLDTMELCELATPSSGCGSDSPPP